MEKREPSYTVGGMQVAPQLGRSVEIDSDQIKTLTENNHCTTWEIADILKIPKSLKFLVKNEKFYFMEKKNNANFLANPTFEEIIDFFCTYYMGLFCASFMLPLIFFFIFM